MKPPGQQDSVKLFCECLYRINPVQGMDFNLIFLQTFQVLLQNLFGQPLFRQQKTAGFGSFFKYRDRVSLLTQIKGGG